MFFGNILSPSRSRLIGVVLILMTWVGAAVLIGVYRSQLPELVASHFDSKGEADGWASRTTLLTMFALLQVGLPAYMLLIGYLLPRLPDSMINVPNKALWFAAAHRASTLYRIQNLVIWLGSVTSLFVLVTFWLAIAANLNDPPRLPTGLLAGFVVALVVSMSLIVIRFMLFFLRHPE